MIVKKKIDPGLGSQRADNEKIERKENILLSMNVLKFVLDKSKDTNKE